MTPKPNSINSEQRQMTGFPTIPPEIPPLPRPPLPQPDETPSSTPTVPSMVFIPKKPVWEYQVIARTLSDNGPVGKDELNALGKDGWELTAVLTHSSSVLYYLKRSR